MVSLKKYTRERIVVEIKSRFKKIASTLDESDFDDYINKAITYLSESLYNPRSMIFTPEQMIYEGNYGPFVDVTNLRIDAITRVYFADKSTMTNSFMDDIGFLPFIAKASGLMTSLADITNYVNLQTNFNMMNRHMELIDDFELLPITSDNRQLLQLRKQGLTWVEYLPQIDYSEDEWLLYDHEYVFVKDYAFALLNLANAEYQMSAVALGVGSEAQTLVNYWEKKASTLRDDWEKHAIITALY